MNYGVVERLGKPKRTRENKKAPHPAEQA